MKTTAVVRRLCGEGYEKIGGRRRERASDMETKQNLSNSYSSRNIVDSG